MQRSAHRRQGPAGRDGDAVGGDALTLDRRAARTAEGRRASRRRRGQRPTAVRRRRATLGGGFPQGLERPTYDPRRVGERREDPGRRVAGAAARERPTATATSAARRSAIAATTGTISGSMPRTGGSETRPAVIRPASATARLSAAVDSERPRSMSACSSSANAASTYQASSGPDANARLTPFHRPHGGEGDRVTQRRAASSIATRSSTPAAKSTGRRPRASARPPVGSSSSSTTDAIVAVTMPTSSNERPRLRISTAVTGRRSPVGTNTSADSSA